MKGTFWGENKMQTKIKSLFNFMFKYIFKRFLNYIKNEMEKLIHTLYIVMS